MSAKPEIPANPDMVNIEVDGVPMQARKGAMIIEVTDANHVPVPRFCYHKKLPVAANCRMCLVQVEKAPKPLPACATPVAEGMKIFTKSEHARSSQKAVMEFLLINHPLDCPICDQGGECELQDLALGYGRDVSRFSEKKRVVEDKNIGPLIATDMTRCIHCTRCIRFLDVIAGYKEMGGTGRGENVKIGTYVERAIESEMSGNIIDVCPVGALTSKPFRFTARAWELAQHPAVAAHDAMGSNVFLHTLRGRVMRAVPRENEAVNEVWLSDRDRFSYQGLYAQDRLMAPLVKAGGELREVEWDAALGAVVKGLRRTIAEHGAEQVGFLVSPNATLEEMHLVSRIAEGLGCANIDHRLRQADFSDQDRAPLYPWLGQELAELEEADAVLLIGSNVRMEQPIAAHRLRKASLNGAAVMCVNPIDYEFRFEVAAKSIVAPSCMVAELAAVTAAVLEGATIPAQIRALLDAAQPGRVHRAIAERLKRGERPTVLLGSGAHAHPDFGALRMLAGVIAERSGARLGYLTDGANGAGGWLAGVLPHRAAGGRVRERTGLDARAMLEQPRKAYVLVGVEPEYDLWDGCTGAQAVADAEFVVTVASFANEAARSAADVLLPVSAFAETSGTFVNGAGHWQSFVGAATPPGSSRPGWKVLRVLGNLLELDGFDYDSSEQVRDELRSRCRDVAPDNRVTLDTLAVPARSEAIERVGDLPIYGSDALVRRAPALQRTALAADAVVRLCAAEAMRLGLADGDAVIVRQEGCEARLPLVVDEAVPVGCAWIPAARPASTGLGPNFGPVGLTKA